MAVRLANLALPVDEGEAALPERISQSIGLGLEELGPWRILRKSLDARNRDALRFIYTVELASLDEANLPYPPKANVRVQPGSSPGFNIPAAGDRPLAYRPTVIGSGPAGLVAAYFLAMHGYQPLVLERGPRVNERIRAVRRFDEGGPFDAESNYLFGEGGAGTFSDGKLTCRLAGADVRWVLELFAQSKGKPSVVYDYRPHLGSNRLPAVVKALRQAIETAGGEVRFNCRVEDLKIRDGRLRSLSTSSGSLDTEVALLATGHSARDVYTMLLRHGIPLTPKAFQMGLRIEQPQELVNRVQYGSRRWEEQLGAADYAVIARGSMDLFSFCMCAGGYVIPSVSQEGYFCTNGMSRSDRAGEFANSGLMVTIRPEQFGGTDVLAGIALQQEYERKAFALGQGEYRCPIQRATDFLAGRPTKHLPASSYCRALVLAQVGELVPPFLAEVMAGGLPILDRRWQGRFLREATLVGPEARGSAPVRILRDQFTRESPGAEGLYPVGEGAGYAGGIVSAAVDGLRSAQALIRKYSPIDRSRFDKEYAKARRPSPPNAVLPQAD